jgi:hypothetical protein
MTFFILPLLSARDLDIGPEGRYQSRADDKGNMKKATGKLYHLRPRVECTLFCNLQSWARTHAVLVIGLYELLGNPTTQLIEPPGPSYNWHTGVIRQYNTNFIVLNVTFTLGSILSSHYLNLLRWIAQLRLLLHSLCLCCHIFCDSLWDF